MNRENIIVRTSLIGIAANVLLAAFKAAVGLLANSIAIVLDAVNNLSDALSSIITIIGTKLAGKKPDKKHPFGYGRIEYLSTMIIAVIVLYAGITSLTESAKKIISPEKPEYSGVMILIVAVAVLVKVLLGLYFQRVGKEVNSDSLIDSGKDAVMDSVISASTVLAAVLYMLKGWSLEAWLGLIISFFIIKSGVEMLKDTISQILGERTDGELAAKIRKIALSFPEVRGVYDLFLNDYGPERNLGSIHIEVPDYMTAEQIDVLIRKIQTKIHEELGVIISAIGIYAYNTKDNEASHVEADIRRIIFSHKNIKEVHGFNVSEENHTVRFDIVIDFEENDRHALYNQIVQEIQTAFPDYTINAVLDTDAAD